MQGFLLYIVVALYLTEQTISIAISPCAKWDRNGTTVIGTGVPGNSSRQFDEPVALSIHEPTNALYIADHGNGRIQMFLLNQLSDNGVTVASNLHFPLHIYIDNDNNQPTIYVSLSLQNRIEKWTKGATKGVQIGDDCQNCVGVAVDKDKNVYITDTLQERVIKWFPQTNETIVVAGKTNTMGAGPELLSNPQGIHVTRNGDAIYIADSSNSRIQKWLKDAKEGITVAGSKAGHASSDRAHLNNPINVLVDDVTNVVYVADTYNHRIMRWLPNAISGEIIAGTGAHGNRSDQLYVPSDLTFDGNGNLYVSDLKNHRIQFFRLISNDPCSVPSSSLVVFTTYRTISTLITLSMIMQWIWFR